MRLKEYLKANGIMVTRFAERLGVTANCLYTYIHRGHMPRLDIAISIVNLTKGEIQYEDLIPLPEEIEDHEKKPAKSKDRKR